MFLLSLWKRNRDHYVCTVWSKSYFGQKHPCSSPARGEIFSTVNGVPLHTAFHYQLFIVLIWLKYCWKGRENASYPFILIRNRMNIMFQILFANILFVLSVGLCTNFAGGHCISFFYLVRKSFIWGGDNHQFGTKTKISIKCWKYNPSSRNFTGAFFMLFFII